MSRTPWTAIYPDGPNSRAAAADAAPGAAPAGNAAYPGAAPAGNAAYPGAAPAGNAAYPGMPAGATPVHRTLRNNAAAGTFTIWAPPADRRFVVASAMISTDSAMRIALVESSDDPGNEIVDGNFAAFGGAAPNLVPVPIPAKVLGAPLLAVIPFAGDVRIRVSGWEEMV